MPTMTMLPMATTVAGEEPESAAKSMQAKTPAIAKPPGKWPTQSYGEADDALGDAASRHKAGGEDKEGDRQQRVMALEGRE